MLVAIISDIHNNEVNLRKVLDYCKAQEIDTIICCGDLASQETLDFMCDNFSGVIHYVFGNMDNDQLREIKKEKRYRNANLYGNHGEFTIENKTIAITHCPDLAKKLCEKKKLNFVFYGHTHKPWEEKIGQCKMLNPGNVAGEIYLPTFAVWDTGDDSFKLIRVHNLE